MGAQLQATPLHCDANEDQLLNRDGEDEPAIPAPAIKHAIFPLLPTSAAIQILPASTAAAAETIELATEHNAESTNTQTLAPVDRQFSLMRSMALEKTDTREIQAFCH